MPSKSPSESAVFEEVRRGGPRFRGPLPTPVDEGDTGESGATLMFSGTGTLPPELPAPAAEPPSVGDRRPSPLWRRPTFSETDFEPEPLAESNGPEPADRDVAARAFPVSLAARADPSVCSRRRRWRAAAEGRARSVPSPAELAVRSPTSAPADSRSAHPRPAPAVGGRGRAVPVEMVEKIAQRVVAQISEKVVREIAWEVIPDLAEALIKQEIERLKAELQKI